MSDKPSSTGRTQDRIIRVFVSSTFRDMHAERDHLVRFVFPELKERCRKQRVNLIDVDLRWGVTEADAQDGKALDICLDEIDSCRPYFLGLLGHRYGWVPEGHDYSITAQEIYHGVLHNEVPRQVVDLRRIIEGRLEGNTLTREQIDSLVHCYKWDAERGKYLLNEDVSSGDLKIIRSVFQNYSAYQRDRSFFFFRSETLSRKLTGENIEDFFEAGQVYQDKLSALKEEIIETGLPYYEYNDIEAFGHQVRDILWGRIEAEIGEPAVAGKDWFEEEAELHGLFMADRTRRFVGRRALLDKMHAFCEGEGESPLMVITGESGCGKSALMGRFAEEMMHNHPDWLIIPHFIGASPSSTNLRQTLKRFCTLLNYITGSLQEVPEDIKELIKVFPDLLTRASEGRKILLILDAVNQLEKTDNAHDMRWLPQALPQNVRMVISTLTGEALDAMLTRRIRPPVEKVTGLNETEIRELVTDYLKEIHHEFPNRQVEQAFFDKVVAGNPLYILVALEELRVFGKFDELSIRVNSLPDNVPALFDQVLKRIESDFNRALVQDCMSYIACGRYGMTAEELQTLLRGRAPHTGSEVVPEKLPDMLWARLYRAFSAYLFKRSGVIDFFHIQLKEAVGKRYLQQGVDRKNTHKTIADYFETRWRETYIRSLDELPHQRTKAEDWEGVEKTLTDLRFIKAKCAAGMTYDLITDYNAALDALPDAQEEKQKRLDHDKRVRKYTNDLIAYAKGEINHLDIIPSVRPWTDEEIKKDTERIIINPTRLNRIRAFLQFVISEGHHLVKFGHMPGFCFQQAYNSAKSGLVASAAEEIVNAEKDAVLLLQLPSQRPGHSPHPAFLMPLEGHKGDVYSVAVTPDGRMAVSGGVDKTIRVWDIETGECLKTLEGHTNSVWSVAVTPDGRMAVSGIRDNTLRVYDIESGECVVIYKAKNILFAVSEMDPACVIVCGSKTVIILKVCNLYMGHPIVTPVCLRLNGSYDDNLTALCKRCGKRFVVENKILDLIKAINRNAGLTPGQSPCLSLPAEAWDDPRLLSECSHCHKPLKFNPFIVDNRAIY